MLTDRFAGTGGSAGGAFKAGTDGGYTGTDRAEKSLQTRMLIDFLPDHWGIEPFNLNIQLQSGEPIPGIDGHHYGNTVGLSALLATHKSWEVYAQYRLRDKWWLTGGWNWLRPDARHPLAGDYRVKYGVLGLRYALKDFDRYLYLNLRGDRSLNQEGTGLGDVITAGFRWNF